MSNHKIETIIDNKYQEVLAAGSSMDATIILVAAFGGLCLFGFKVYEYYNNFDKDFLSKEHGLSLIVMLFSFIILPLLGVAFVGMYEINNHIAAWQIGLTTPMIIESACIAATSKAKKGNYHDTFTPEQQDA